MPAPNHQLPQNVLDALERRQKIQAIKLLREATGLGLKDAKDAVEAHLNGSPVVLPTSGPRSSAVPASVVQAMERGNKIEAIRLLRESTGVGLKEAKDAVEALQPLGSTGMGELSPGTSSRSGALLGWLLLLVGAVTVGLLALQRLG